jgi:hypothetical protein
MVGHESAHFYLLPALVGFNFAFQTVLTILFFKTEPQQATLATLALNLLCLCLALFSTFGEAPSLPASCLRTPVIWWTGAFLGLALLSVFWSAAALLSAAGYWVIWASGVGAVWLLLRRPEPIQQANSLMMGVVWGASIVALVAWIIPPTADLRLGDEDLLHPNVIGRLFAIATLLAIYLAHHNRIWRWPVLWLSVTLLRSLSKTSILAFVAAVLFYLIYDSTLTRAAKIRIGLIASTVLLALGGVLETYLESYAESSSVETLTGRTLIWAASADFILDKPWLGYGLYSYRTVVPRFGRFEAWEAHNELLQQIFSFGLPGLVVVIALYWTFFRQIRRSPRSPVKTLAATLLVFTLVRGLTDAEIYDLSCPLWLIAMLSILLCSTCNQPENLPSTSPSS